jgi:hypothetical protein
MCRSIVNSKVTLPEHLSRPSRGGKQDGRRDQIPGEACWLSPRRPYQKWESLFQGVPNSLEVLEYMNVIYSEKKHGLDISVLAFLSEGFSQPDNAADGS